MEGKYSDAYQMQVTPWGVNLLFLVTEIEAQTGPTGVTAPQPHKQTPVAAIHMSAEHAKIMVIQMHRALKTYEETRKAPIQLDPRIAEDNKVTDKDW